MYINPQGTIKIYRDIPWHSDLKETRLFTTESDQLTFMERHRKYTVDNVTYAREQKALRVPIVADNLFDCNYVSFQNRGFGNKNFYAFITDVKYVNNETSEITFMIDEFQTWWFETTVGSCFVEREHVDNDTVGLHTQPEDVNYGDNVVWQQTNYYFTDWWIQFKVKPTIIGLAVGTWGMEERENQYTVTVKEVAMTQGNIAELVQWLNNEAQNGNDVISAKLYPSEFNNEGALPIEVGANKCDRFFYPQSDELVTSYVPKNNKLFTYPYCFLRVTNNIDSVRDYHWEFFHYGERPSFVLRHVKTNGISCELEPVRYERSANRLWGISINEFPSIDYNSMDILAPLKTSIGAVGGILGACLGEGVGSAIKLGANVAGSLTGGLRDHSQNNVQLSGGSGALQVRHDRFGFSFYSMSISREYAESIDNYFTRYGYRINRYKTPQMYSRRYFNYVKTANCILHGNLPDSALKTISGMFDSGVTLWHVDDVGGFYPDNPIV